MQYQIERSVAIQWISLSAIEFMKRLLVAIMLASVVCDGAGASPASPAPPTAPVTRRIVARAREWFQRFQTGNIDRSQLNAAVNSQLTESGIRDEGAKLRTFGKPTSFIFLRSYIVGGVFGYDFLIPFKKGRIVEMIAFDPDGRVAGIDFKLFVLDSGQISDGSE